MRTMLTAFRRSLFIVMLLAAGVALQAAPAMANNALPAELAAFKKEAEEAFRSKNMETVRTVFHPDFKTDGRSLAQQIDYLSVYVPMFQNWELAIHGFAPDGELLKLDAEYKTGVGNFPETVHLKRHEGKWRFYGNQK